MPTNLDPPRTTGSASPAAKGPNPARQRGSEENAGSLHVPGEPGASREEGSAGVQSAAAEKFVPRRFLRNGHVQTLAGNYLRRHNRLPEPEERFFQVEENVQVLCHCHWQPQHESRPTVLVVHGLEGSSLSKYVIGTGSKAWDVGMNVVRMNMRNRGGTDTLAPTLYHSGMSADVGAVAHTLCSEEGLERVALIGYSMGGNLVLKLAGEWSHNAPPELKAVAAVSPVTDLAASADAM